MLIIAIIFILIVVVGIAIGIKKSDNRDNLQSTQKQTETSAENTDSEEDA